MRIENHSSNEWLNLLCESRMLGVGIRDCGKDLLREFQLLICQDINHSGIVEYANIKLSV